MSMAPSIDRNDAAPPRAPVLHGHRELGLLQVGGYSLQLRSRGGFLGDEASQTAFRELLERWRRRRRRRGRPDPLGEARSAELSKKTLDRVLRAPLASEASDLLHAAIEEFALDLARVIQRFLAQPSWRGVQRVVIGGGFPESDVGERAILQAAAVLDHLGLPVQLARLSHEVDDGGLIGWVHLVPPAMRAGHQAILAVDIGGTNLRCGIVKLRQRKAPDLSRARVVAREKWRHADEMPSRTAMVDALAALLQDMIRRAGRRHIRLAPFIGIACPGLIRRDGSIARGAQNLPGDWTSRHFHLPTEIARRIPSIGGLPTCVQIHNDAVVQGLSEAPFMRDVRRWAVLTIGTGLGNASFASRSGVSGALPVTGPRR